MEKEKSWFSRNWVWAVPGCGCVGVILFVVFGLGAAFFGLKNFVTNSTPYEYAVEQAVNNPEVIQILGDPVETDGMMSGNVSIQNESGNANFTVPLKGANGFGTLVVVAERFDGKWVYEDLYVDVHETLERVDLLDQIIRKIDSLKP
ncbi:MAG: hypothetical protein COB73_08515 [Flavobacteriaceae bacterium]|nr:MAG: hypothetical protein COB73_08515 [Flavobacteriaceae bacterium]